MDNKIFSLGCVRENSCPYAWELELGNREIRQKLEDGDCVFFNLRDGTQMCLKMASNYLLLAESVSPSGQRGMSWYWSHHFVDYEVEDDDGLTAGELLRRIYLRAKEQNPKELIGAFAE